MNRPLRRQDFLFIGSAILGAGIAVYLGITKLIGVTPICGPSGGCASVETSAFSSIGGVPVAFVGLGFSLATLIAWIIWWRRGDRRGLYVAYVLGLAGTVVEAGLVFLELFVIHAICIWCVAYGVTVVAGFAIAVSTVVGVDRSGPTGGP